MIHLIEYQLLKSLTRYEVMKNLTFQEASLLNTRFGIDENTLNIARTSFKEKQSYWLYHTFKSKLVIKTFSPKMIIILVHIFDGLTHERFRVTVHLHAIIMWSHNFQSD